MMPAYSSAMEPLTGALKNAFQGYKKQNDSNGLDQGLAAAAKKNMLKQVDFEGPIRVLGGQAASSSFILLNPLRGASPRPNDGSQTNGNGARTTQTKEGEKQKNGKAEKNPNAPALPKHVFFPLSSVSVGYHSKRLPGAGMYNVGNTCYLNSTLQALFHTPALYNYLMSGVHARQCSRSNNQGGGGGFYSSGPPCMICALTSTLKDTIQQQVIRPNKVYEKLKTICKHMVQGRQEDAHEFLRYLIESLQRGFLASSACPVPLKTLDTASKETTPFNQIFGGYLRQDVTCLKCRYVSVTFQHFMDLLLDIRTASTLEEALQNYFRAERLGSPDGGNNMYKCDQCKVKVPAKKKSFIERPPVVLCVQLKRFSLFGGKITKPVALNKTINLASFVKTGIPLRQNQQQLNYKLVSMITHVGPSPNCGHYTAIGEAGNGSFYQFDDSSVRPISQHQALNTASYVVMYEMTQASKDAWVSDIKEIKEAKAAKAVKTMGPSPQQRPMIGPERPPLPSTVTSATNGNEQKMMATNGIGAPSVNGSNGPNRIGVLSKPKPTPILTNGHVNTTTQNKVKPGGLVPYDDDDDSSAAESDNERPTTAPTVSNGHPSTPRPSYNPFVPRAVAMKQNKTEPETPVTPIAESTASSSGKWKVSDSDAHNPSEHSNNSTGSTSSWRVTANGNGNGSRPGSAQSTGTSEIMATPPPPGLLQQKRGSLKRSNSIEEYEEDLDRGRTKKVKNVHTPTHAAASHNSSNGNMFQHRQTQQYNGERSNGSNGSSRSSWGGNSGSNTWSSGGGNRFNNSHQRDHSYHAGNNGRRGNSNGNGGNLRRAQSFGNLSNSGGSDSYDPYKDRKNNRQRGDDRRFYNGGGGSGQRRDYGGGRPRGGNGYGNRR